jgi:hypothetical protein
VPKLKDVCRHIRSKNAGPFWITIDLFFDGPDSYRQYHEAACLSADAIGAFYGVDPHLVRRFDVGNLNVVKYSIPRKQPQGGVFERDMHGGQQYVPLLNFEV